MMRVVLLARHKTPKRFQTGLAAGLVAVLSLVLVLPAPKGPRAAETPRIETPSGLPVPRFVSIKAARANVRQGPSPQHAIMWIYVRKGIPVEVVAETQNWRRIRDIDGREGWVHANLLDGARTAIVLGKDLVAVRKKPEDDADPAAWAEPGLVAKLLACEGAWCEVSAQKAKGWLPRADLWGVLPGESFE